MFGFYLYGLCELSLINGIYLPIDTEPPRWFNITEQIIRNKKILYFVLVMVFYGFVYSDKNRVFMWTQSFYAVLTFIICIESFAIVFVLSKVHRMLGTVPADFK